MKTIILGLAALTLAVIIGVIFFGSEQVRSPIGTPWQIEALPDGTSRVFGLTLSRSTLGDARVLFGADMEIAVVAAPRETGTLEAYYSQVNASGITGRLVLVGDLKPETVLQLRDHVVKFEYMESATKRFILDPADLPLAHGATIASITFVPSVNLDEETVLGRFGTPHERVRTSEHVEHFLYPDRGLDLALDSKGKEVLQYVPPREFSRLREPLLKH